MNVSQKTDTVPGVLYSPSLPIAQKLGSQKKMVLEHTNLLFTSEDRFGLPRNDKQCCEAVYRRHEPRNVERQLYILLETLNAFFHIFVILKKSRLQFLQTDWSVKPVFWFCKMCWSENGSVLVFPNIHIDTKTSVQRLLSDCQMGLQQLIPLTFLDP